MSIEALKPALRDIRADGHITLQEVNTLTSPQTLGAYTDKDELELITNLAADITPEGSSAVATEARKKNSLVKRGVKITGIMSGIASSVPVFASILAMVGGAVAGGFAGLGIAALFTALPALVVCGIGTGALIGLGALGGYIHSKIKQSRNKDLSGPVTADADAKAALEALIQEGPTAKDHVKKGAKVGGIVAGALSGVGAIGWMAVSGVLGANIAAASGVGAAIAFAGVTFLPFGAACLAVAALCVGIGALVGYIRSKRSED